MKRNRKSYEISRRNFLKAALTATGGVALASCSRGGSATVPATVMAQLPSATAAVGATATPALSIYTDPSRSTEDRVNDLVGRMTLAEKISQMGSEAAEIKRLGVAKYNWWNEALHGVARDGIATVFPQVIGLAATWNADLVHQMATVISDEGRAKHHDSLRNGVHDLYTGLTYFCPNVNIFRDPRWGRGQETYGEDPYLTSRLAVNFIRGMQGDDPRYLKTVATAKHFAVHSGPDADRHSFNAVVSQSDLRMTYLPAFQACIMEAKSYSIMGAYNRVNGEACNASPTLLQKILRGEWGFAGYVVADCGAVDDIYLNHNLANSPQEAAAMAVKAGCDLECGCTYGIACDYGKLTQAVEQGMITEDDITRAVKRLFTARFLLGEFDPDGQVAYAQIPMSVVDSDEHRALALEVARQSLVLLKNAGGLLPLDKGQLKSIAVIGPNADETLVLNGNYNGTPAAPVTVLAGIRALLSPDTKVNYARGSDILNPVDNGIVDAVKAASASEVVVVVGGLSQQVEGEAGQQEGNPPGVTSLGDRTSLDLPSAQEELLEAVFKTGTPVILVLLNGSAVSINWANAHIPAILEAWYPGESGGTAVAEAIFGLANPGGRLPVTFYQSVDDLPDFKDYNMKNRTYRYFTGKPLYPFGYGLSYTTFAYDNLQISPATVKQGDSVSVKADVENTGSRAGDEVVQLYLKDEASSLPVPGLQLQGFARVHLASAEKQTVEFTVTAAQMSAADESGKWVLEPGAFKIWVGGQQPDPNARAQSANVLEGEFTVQA